MKYVKSANKEYIFDDGRNMNGIEKHKPDEGGKMAEKTAKKFNKPVFIMRTIGYIDHDL